MDAKLIKNNVKCCACEGTLKTSRHVNGLMLDRLATWPYPVAGNVLAPHRPQNYAIAILCDKCIKDNKKPKLAVEWNKDLSLVKYHPIEELKHEPPITEEDLKKKEMEMRPRDIFVFIDKDGKRYEFSNEPENCVVVRLEQDFDRYHVGEDIVIPREVAKLIKCKILTEWAEWARKLQ